MNPQRPILTRIAVGLLVLVASAWLASPAPAQDLTKEAQSLKWIPADAGSYSVMLRNREQIDIILKSKAWARIMSLPAVKMLEKKFDEEWNKPGGELEKVRDALKIPGVADGLELLKAMFADEIFFYSDRNTADFLAFLGEVNSTNQFFPLEALLKGNFDAIQQPEARGRHILQMLNDNTHRIKMPDNVIGFRIGKEKATQFAKMLESATTIVAGLAPPAVKDRIKKVQINGNDVYTITVDGTLVPWEMVPLNQIEEVPGQFNKLINHLKKTTITVSVGVRDDFLLLSLGEGTAGLKALGGAGKRLIDRPELAPLANFKDKRLTSIGYTSKEYREVLAGSNKVEDTVKSVNELFKDANLTAAQKAKILRDVKAFHAELDQFTPKLGAELSFTFLTPRGTEGYDYDWTKNPGQAVVKTLSILDYLGGDPLAFGAGNAEGGGDKEGYEFLVKWIRKAHEYFEEFGLPQIPDPDFRDKYQMYMKQLKPLFVRLDKATGKMLLPSLDGQAAIVLDAKLKIKTPITPNDMPAPELGIVIGLRDPELFRKAFQEYREIANGIIEVIAGFTPGVPDVKIPPAQSKKTAAGTLYYYSLPDIPGLDPKISPTAGIGAKVGVFALSHSHANRLMTKTPLKVKEGLLTDTKQPLVSAGYFNWAGLMDAALPWVDEGLKQGRAPNDAIEQVQIVMEVLKVFRGVSSITYLEQGATVTRSEAIFRDLEK